MLSLSLSHSCSSAFPVTPHPCTAHVRLFFPSSSEAEHVKFPKDISDAQQLGLVLSRYKDRYFFPVLGGVCVTYLFLQTFAIPGSISLSIVSGFLFPFPIALLLVSIKHFSQIKSLFKYM